MSLFYTITTLLNDLQRYYNNSAGLTAATLNYVTKDNKLR